MVRVMNEYMGSWVMCQQLQGESFQEHEAGAFDTTANQWKMSYETWHTQYLKLYGTPGNSSKNALNK